MRIGVTGSYSSGKGTVCTMFEKLGAVNIDTDEIARKIVMPGKPAYEKLIGTFGKEILNQDSSINRQQLADIVFKNKNLLKTLNSITHPEILKIVLNQTEDKMFIYVINTPLLFESGYNEYMDYNVLVKANDRLSVKRGILRDNITEKEIKLRLKNQFSINKKIKLSDYIIDNSENLENTNIQVNELWKILNRLKNQK